MKSIKMKTFTCVLFAMLTFRSSSAQFVKAELQAAGLTCSMCSKAVDKQLRTLDFIDSVGIDLEKATFILYFKKDADVDLAGIRKKVEDAGFSVAMLKTTYMFANTQQVGADMSFKDHGRTYYVLDYSGPLNGEVILKVIDKGYAADKEFKKYAGQVKSKGDGGSFHFILPK
jgi:copper chaperone CopZ